MSCGDLPAIGAVFYSSDDHPDHELCPPGENLWCGFQRDLAKETTEYTHPLPSAVASPIH